jgi:hypothetical protein
LVGQVGLGAEANLVVNAGRAGVLPVVGPGPGRSRLRSISTRPASVASAQKTPICQLWIVPVVPVVPVYSRDTPADRALFVMKPATLP